MLANIVDKRKNIYNVECDAVFEPSQHDNSVSGATQFPAFNYKDHFTVYDMDDTTIAQATAWANEQEIPVTMYLYDVGTNSQGRTAEEIAAADAKLIPEFNYLIATSSQASDAGDHFDLRDSVESVNAFNELVVASKDADLQLIEFVREHHANLRRQIANIGLVELKVTDTTTTEDSK
jgi:hypothetical protein